MHLSYISTIILSHTCGKLQFLNHSSTSIYVPDKSDLVITSVQYLVWHKKTIPKKTKISRKRQGGHAELLTVVTSIQTAFLKCPPDAICMPRERFME